MMQAFFDMRQAQKRYFSMQNDYNLKLAKTKERKVDDILTEMAKQGFIKTQPTPPPVQQTTLL